MALLIKKEQISQLIKVFGDGSGYSYCDSSGDGYGDGDGYGSGYSDGSGYGDSSGDGYGSGYSQQTQSEE